MDIDEIINNLNEQIQALEDMKTNIIELQEETRSLITNVNMWFEQNEHLFPEVKTE